MSTFASVWAIKTDQQVNPGAELFVTLKNGKSKPVTVDKFLYSQQDRYGSTVYFYLPAKQDS